eukprot:6106282-Karenia_brevis.AAC.1
MSPTGHGVRLASRVVDLWGLIDNALMRRVCLLLAWTTASLNEGHYSHYQRRATTAITTMIARMVRQRRP